MNYKLIELLIPVIVRLLELLLSKEEASANKDAENDHAMADAMRKKYPGKSDEQIIEEAFA